MGKRHRHGERSVTTIRSIFEDTAVNARGYSRQRQADRRYRQTIGVY
jgi:hypothetical protein